MTVIDCVGARVRGRPAVRGCCGAGIRPSAWRCWRARDPMTSSRDPTASTANRVATITAIATALTAFGHPGAGAGCPNPDLAKGVGGLGLDIPPLSEGDEAPRRGIATLEDAQHVDLTAHADQLERHRLAGAIEPCVPG